MDQYITLALGIMVLIGLVAYQRAMHHRKYRKLQRCWEEGESALRAGQFEAAERALQQAVNTEGLWIPARQLLAQVHALQGKLDQAEQEYQMAAALQPKSAMGQFALALFYAGYHADRQKDALDALERAATLDPKILELLQQHRDHFQALHQEPRFQTLLQG